MLKVLFLFLIFIVATVAQFYPYPFLPYHHHQPSHLPAYLPAAAPQPSAALPPSTTYYIIQAPPQPIYRTVESAEVNGTPTYAAQPPPGTVAIAPPPPPPSALSFPGQTYFIAAPYSFPPGATILHGPSSSGYPFPPSTGGTFYQGPTLVAPPYEKKLKTRVTSSRISS